LLFKPDLPVLDPLSDQGFQRGDVHHLNTQRQTYINTTLKWGETLAGFPQLDENAHFISTTSHVGASPSIPSGGGLLNSNSTLNNSLALLTIPLGLPLHITLNDFLNDTYNELKKFFLQIS